MIRRHSWLVCVLILALAGLTARADEGMWTFNNFPKQLVAQRYGFTPSDAWLDHIRLSSVRFSTGAGAGGGSGSFVSPNGLMMTNHHVGARCIQEVSSAARDYIANGFYAAAPADELRCPNVELIVLESIADVTAAVNAGVTAEMDAAARSTAQRAAMARLEKECSEKTGLRCDIVVLYEGGVFNLYRYKRYTDVRLVFAPEGDIAVFGGDPDNFTFPRYNLDVAFFRAYENGRPARVEHYLTWNPAGIQEGDVVFVSGNPGTSGRKLTMAQLEFLRDVTQPHRLELFRQRLKKLYEFAARGPEEARVAHDVILSYENSLKAYTGYQAGLLDPNLMSRRAATEKELRAQVAADPKMQTEFGEAWERIAQAQKIYAQFYKEHQLLEQRIGLRQVKLFQIARHLVRMPIEKAKPNEQRLREYRESNLAGLEQDLFSPAPISASLEAVLLGRILTEVREALGSEHPLVKQILAGESAEQAAQRHIAGSKLAEVAVRRKLAEGGPAAVEASDDAMIRLAGMVDSYARTARKRFEDEVEGVERKNGSLLARAFFATRGTTTYPDATFTPRLSFGALKGYIEDGRPIRWYTTFHGLYERACDIAPYKLDRRWIAKKAALNMDVPFNFVSTNDIIGGNSGSPIVNRNGELVGIIFDGNIQQLPNDYLYTDEVARSISVHAAGILEALEKIYGAKGLVNELRLAGP